MVAHNMLVSVLVESGLVGFTLYFLFWGLVIRRILLLPKADRFFWLSVFVLTIPTVIAGSAEYYKPLWFLAGMVLCQADNCKIAVAGRRRIPMFRPGGVGPSLRPPSSRPLRTGTENCRGK